MTILQFSTDSILVSQTRAFIVQRITETRSAPQLDECATNVGMIPRTFQRALRSFGDTTFQEVLDQTRLKMAKELLMANQRTYYVEEALGFHSGSFRRFFKRQEGMSPRDWRKQYLAAQSDAVREELYLQSRTTPAPAPEVKEVERGSVTYVTLASQFALEEQSREYWEEVNGG